MDRDGHDTTEALRLLVTLRKTQALHRQDVEWILQELGGAIWARSIRKRVAEFTRLLAPDIANPRSLRPPALSFWN